MRTRSLRFSQIALAFAFSLVLSTASTLLAQDTWEMRSPTPTSNRIASYVYGNGQFVGVGGLGEIVTSPDGATWTRRDSGVLDQLKRVVFGANKFVAISAESLLTSTNGVAWNRQPGKFIDLAFGNGVFIAIVQPASPLENVACQILTSPDAVTWTPRQSFSSLPARLLFANGVFVAASPGGRVQTTNDGITWTAVTVTETSSHLVSFTAGNDRFLLSYGGGGYLSTDGLIWRNVTAQVASPITGVLSPVPNPGDNTSMGFANGYFHVRQEAGFVANAFDQYRSADGENWTAISPTLDNFDFSTLASGGGMSVASEVARLPYGDENSTRYVIHSSSDGVTWISRSSTAFTSEFRSLGRSLTYALGRFFAAGKSSNDGISWADCGFAPTHVAGDLAFRITNMVAVSADGVSSHMVEVKMSGPRSVAFGDVYVMVGAGGSISSSIDGFTWSARTSGTTKNLNAVTYAFNRFIAIGDSGAFLTSPDGLTWTTLDSAGITTFDLTHIVAGADRLAVAASSMVPNAIPGSLTLDGGVSVHVTVEPRFAAMTFFKDTFLALSTSRWSTGYYPQLWKSTDAVSWTEIPIHIGLGPSERTEVHLALTVGNDTAALLAYDYIPFYAEAHALLQTPYIGSRPPTITDQPWSATRSRGESVLFAVGVTGNGPMTYQWFRNGQPMANAIHSVLTIKSINDTEAGDYSVTVTNAAGSATSAAAGLTVVPPVPLTIIQQPVSGELFAFQPMTLTVKVTGSGPITYQWRRNGIPISNATSASYRIEPSWHGVGDYTGSIDVVVSAPYSTVTSEPAILTWGPSLSLALAPTGPINMAVGQTLRLTAKVTGAPPFTYSWSKSGKPFEQATSSTLILPFLTLSDSGLYLVAVTDPNGQQAVTSVNVTVSPSDPTPISPTATAEAGQEITLRTDLTDPSWWKNSFQWRHNGGPIPDASSPTYTIKNFAAKDTGTYDVVVTAPDGTTSIQSAIRLNLDGSRLVNLSARAVAGASEDTMIIGFVLNGAPSTASPDVLVRSIGPTLVGMGVNGTLADPAIRVLDRTASLIAENDNWSTVLTTGRGIAATAAEMARFGAFTLSSASRDSAVLVHEPPAGPYTALVSAVSGGTGIVLNEIYGPTSGTQRLVNLSARARVSSGDSVLIAGFVITGNSPLKVLIRGVGPTLSTQGIAQPLANPTLTLYNSIGQIAHNNDNWGQAANAPDIRSAGTAAGAFLLNEGSHDAAILETLAPGIYTVHVTSADTSSGVALVEIYEAP